MGRGRPSDYDPAICKKICDRIASSELGLEQVLDEIRLTDGKAPAIRTVYQWLEKNPEFAQQSARARQLQAQIIHDRAQIVAQTPLIGRIEKTVVNGKGEEMVITVADNVERSKLIVQTMLKRAGQLAPKKYGDRLISEHSGPDGGPIQCVTRSILEDN